MSLQVIHHSAPGLAILPLQRKAVPLKADSYKPGTFRHFLYHVSDNLKTALVVKVLSSELVGKAIVYVRTNFAADQLAETLNRAGLTAQSFHENKSQRTKLTSLTNFRDRATNVMVVTESAATEICLAEVTTIISYSLPVSAETYRRRLSDHSGISGASAKAFLFCDKGELGSLSNINRALGEEIEVLEHNLV